MAAKSLEAEAATWAERARVAVASRDKAIRALLEEGATLRHVAEVVGLSHVAVAKIRDRA